MNQPRTKFKELREKNDLSQLAMAVRLNISLGTICEFEQGNDRNFSPRIRRKLAEGYGVPIEEVDAACGASTAQSVS